MVLGCGTPDVCALMTLLLWGVYYGLAAPFSIVQEPMVHHYQNLHGLKEANANLWLALCFVV